MSDSSSSQKKERFAPKQPVNLAPPKDDVITRDYLAKCDGKPLVLQRHLVRAFTDDQGDVFDVSGKDTYAPGKNYHVFTGKEPNRALGLSSLEPKDCISDYSDLAEDKLQVLNDWHTFFSKRYNIVGLLQPENNASL
ncbi:cytochrome b5-like Heme/Steroid binding domain-containing protein [Paraphaeosphaeria minitans]|uniref:Cytochrome b5-like Heme/Steroid binding domain-containing protein n=1 Tax=Paraphaeosphaeria minitans TaxID=565426 RepID=A0A9P6GRZ8_9PLEO|nr:cytochrome b5-like Heme/Steroid binding domain-containing protein [Paraphaeosphaeria minitans]